ncbi:MAG: hypothetical protein ACJ8EI_05125 [Sphingomicrobium sp.]
MSKGESDIGGGRSRRIQRRAPRGSLQDKPKRRAFTEARRQRFLNHFAASCNARAAARAVGISENCVHAWRQKDPQFNAGWKEALELGYARLEAELIRSATESLKIRPRKNAAVRVGTMSAETALRVLEAYRRTGGRDRGTVWPHPYDVEGVRARLEAKMKALRLIDEDGRPIARLPAPDTAQDPSSVTPCPSPRNREEDD